MAQDKSPPPERLRLGTSGAWRLPDRFPPLTAQEEALLRFLLAVERVAPQAPLTLRDDVLEPGQEGAGKRLAAWKKRWKLDRWRDDDAELRFDMAIHFVLTAWAGLASMFDSSYPYQLASGSGSPEEQTRLRREAERSRREARWSILLDAFTSTADVWAHRDRWFRDWLAGRGAEQAARAWIEKHDEYFAPSFFEPLRFSWNPFVETWGEARKRLNKMARTYRARVEKGLDLAGAEKEPEKRNLDHFAWLARIVVLDETPKTVAEGISGDGGEAVEEGAIQKRAKELADRIGIEMPRRLGRPRKT
jgi:hypothetical protein